MHRTCQVRAFDAPDVMLEQYKTSSHLAAHMLFTIQDAYGEIEGKTIADFGCGTGILAIGSQVLGAGYGCRAPRLFAPVCWFAGCACGVVYCSVCVCEVVLDLTCARVRCQACLTVRVTVPLFQAYHRL